MLNPEVFLVAQVYEAIIAAPAIRVNNTFKFHAAPDDPLEGDF